MRFSPSIVSGLVAVADGLAVVGTGFVIYLLYVGWNGENYPLYFSALAIHTALVLTTFYFAGLYNFGTISRRRAARPKAPKTTKLQPMSLRPKAVKSNRRWMRLLPPVQGSGITAPCGL